MPLPRLRIGVAALTVLGLAACQSDVPTGVDVDPAFSLADVPTQDQAPRHIVMFDDAQGIPGDFDGAVAALGGSVERALAQVGIALVTGLSDEAAATLTGRDDVSVVEPDAMIQLEEPVSLQAEATDGAILSADDPTLATRYARQWNMRAIQADVAWAAGALGSADVTVAILDTGIDYTYPDLAGLVDLSRSASFVASDDALVNVFFPGRELITDLHYHGTHVANTVASNGNIVAGVTSKTTLIGVKVCNVFGRCPTSSVLEGIVHAADNGADVANMSLGGGFLKSQAPGFVSLIQRTLNYAAQNGTLVVVASGNAGADLDHATNVFAAYCDAANVACVSATGPTASAGVNGPWTDVDAPASYSNIGRSAISVAGPGGTGAGFVWQACSQTSLVIPVCQTGTFILGLTGTSMATPHASGVAALMAQEHKTAQSLRSALQNTADDLGQPGVDPFYGKGRVNAANAVGAN